MRPLDLKATAARDRKTSSDSAWSGTGMPYSLRARPHVRVTAGTYSSTPAEREATTRRPGARASRLARRHADRQSVRADVGGVRVGERRRIAVGKRLLTADVDLRKTKCAPADLVGCTHRDDAPFVDDGDAVAELFGFLDVV